MPEGTPLPDFSDTSEVLSPPNPYYQAVTENQSLWREAQHSITHEMPRVSQKIEENMKRVFADYIDPAFPRVLVAWSLLLDTSSYEAPYHHAVSRYPEHIKEEDQEPYEVGMYHLNEWATNYAAMHYLEHASTNPLTMPIRQAYAWYGDTIVGRVMTPYTYKAMREVKKAARENDTNLDNAVFQALFQHNFTHLSALVTNTEILEKNSLDELAIEIGEHSATTFDPTKSMFRHFTPKPTDSPFVKVLKNTADSAFTGGQFTEPGIVQTVLAVPAAFSTIGALEGAMLSGTLKETVTTAGMLGSMTASTHPFIIIHESVHGYSASSDYTGLLPRQIVQGEIKGWKTSSKSENDQ